MFHDVKPRPSAWDAVCEECAEVVRPCGPRPNRAVRHDGCRLGLVAYPKGGRTFWPRTRGVAIWGENWAAVAWLAASEEMAVEALSEECQSRGLPGLHPDDWRKEIAEALK